jgi:hypothetical protein
MVKTRKMTDVARVFTLVAGSLAFAGGKRLGTQCITLQLNFDRVELELVPIFLFDRQKVVSRKFD